MRATAILVCVAALALRADAAQRMTVAQLQQTVASAHGMSDAEVAAQLAAVELTERLSAAGMAQLGAGLPGNKAREQLVIVADASAFLAPPDAEIGTGPTPDAAALRAMMVKVVDYVNNTVRQLPNFIATRSTTAFEDRPQEDALEATGVVSYSAVPLHEMGSTSVRVTYRDRREVVDEGAARNDRHGNQAGGLVTAGEFGPMLSRVVADAIQGKIMWGRWEKAADGDVAVFRYQVPPEKSHYKVEFCCVRDAVDMSGGVDDLHVFSETASYHGEIAFDAATGAILRISMEAEMPQGELISKAAMLVEYGPVDIGGKQFTCPSRSISILQAHTTQQKGMYSRANYQGSAKTFLNDVEFRQYRRFGTETRILDTN